MPIEILHRYTSAVLYSAATSPNTRAAVAAAVAAAANLRGANLRGANLRGADLRWANMRGADLREANLREANLRGADLRGANLSGADLSGADLSGANLRGADLRGADLSGADLSGAKISEEQLRSAKLDAIRDDFWAVLSAVPNEVAGLRLALVEGRINGSQYQGECACLVGTVAKVRGCAYDAMPELQPNDMRASERWFLAILQGHTPANNPIAKITLEWLDEWTAKQQAEAQHAG